jgi:signal transduction histidine kinase
LAWMGMVASTWRHTIAGYAVNIRDELARLRSSFPTEMLTEYTKKLSRIERLAQAILEAPITPPLSSEEAVVSVVINDMLREHLEQLQQNEPYKSVNCIFDTEMDENVTVRISRMWLLQAFDIVVNNGIEAMYSSSFKQLTIKTRLINNWVTISVSDTGSGIPASITSKLFKEPIIKHKGGKGLGMGMLLAQTVVQTYGGDIQLDFTGFNGTTIILRLPVEH